MHFHPIFPNIPIEQLDYMHDMNLKFSMSKSEVTIILYSTTLTSISIFALGMASIQSPNLEIFPLSHPTINVLSGEDAFS